MKGWKLGLAGLAAAAAIAAAVKGVSLLRRERGPGPSARTVEAVEGPIEESIEATGAVAPWNRVEIKPPIAGRMERLLVEEGQSVKVGQIVAWMSSNDRAAILDAARAQGPAEYRRWQDAYKATPIVASLPGLVILRNAVVGQTVDPGSVLFAVSDSLIVLAQVDESDIGRVKAGMPARVTLDSYPDRADEGEVFDVLYEGKNVSNVITYGVKIRLKEIPPHYRSQMTANVRFIAGRKEKAVLIPAAAVRQGPDGASQVRVAGPGGEPSPREVKTGIEADDMVEVLSGLAAGERVVVGRSRYTPQQAPQSSPLALGTRRPGQDQNFGQAPRPRRQGNSRGPD